MADESVPQERCDFYVYAMTQEDGTTFYVGKGKGSRHRDHLRPSALNRSAKASIIRRMLAAGLQVPVTKIAECLTEAAAFALERETIARLGRRPDGPLCNLTDGGEGARGARHSAAFKAELSARMRDAMADPDVRAAKSLLSKGMWADPLFAAAMSAKQKAIQSTDAARAAKKLKTAASWTDPATRARRLEAQKAALSTSEARARKVAAKKTPQAVAEQSARAKSQWSDPVKRAALIAAQNAGKIRAAKARVATKYAREQGEPDQPPRTAPEPPASTASPPSPPPGVVPAAPFIAASTPSRSRGARLA